MANEFSIDPQEMVREDRLELEIARLRAVLVEIAEIGQSGSLIDDPCPVSIWCAERAKNALNFKGKDHGK